jgi:tRNA pseudouridine32 synthase/23S rRNA pseudouridine746 synthase
MKKDYRFKISTAEKLSALDYLKSKTDISKETLKKLFANGAVWLVRKGQHRIRRVTAELRVGDEIRLYFDDQLLNLEAPAGILIEETKDWGVWFKPPGLLSQGTQYGDHCALLRQVEKLHREVFLVHRLDREVAGLMIFAYNGKAAAYFSQNWNTSSIAKEYQAKVLGKWSLASPYTCQIALEDKPAETWIDCLQKKNEFSWMRLKIKTGKYHQIRQHLNLLGHPVMGDPEYGQNNKNRDGMKLMATRLDFVDLDGKKKTFMLPDTQIKEFLNFDSADKPSI